MKQTIEQRKVASLAREYRERGYKVFAHLQGYPHPKRFGRFVPDLVVEKGDEKILIEVVSSTTMKDQRQAIAELAERAASEKGMRFDLVVTNPRPLKRDKNTKAIRQLKKLETDLLRVLDFAAETNQVITFFVVAGVVIEHLVTNLWEERFDQRPDGHNLIKLASGLRDEKIISELAFNFIRETWELRNACLHGPPEVAREIHLKETSEKLKSLALSYAGAKNDLGSREQLT